MITRFSSTKYYGHDFKFNHQSSDRNKNFGDNFYQNVKYRQAFICL